MNLVIISHCNFKGNSAMHVFSIANELVKLGAEVVVCVPDSPETVHSHGVSKFLALDYDQARSGAIAFSAGRGPDLIHAWTPREGVRKITEELVVRYACPYLVHLEDNEEVILKNDLQVPKYQDLYYYPEQYLDSLVSEHHSHPIRYREFLGRANGITALMDRLLEFKPEGIPSLVFWPGFDSEFGLINGASSGLRERIGLGGGTNTIAYTGNVHASNVREVRSLYLAAGILHRRGLPIRLLRTGWDFVPLQIEAEFLSQYVKDLGFLPREDLPALISLADVLVQPGKPDEFNDYRFPSKLPEYLASGRPVILPRSNIGRFITDGVEGILLQEGHAEEIANHVQRLLDDRDLARCVGEGGKSFAVQNLTWSKNVGVLHEFYREAIAARTGLERVTVDVSSPWSKDVEPVSALPAKLIAFYLPQFHPIPENDQWWGKGFTEWRNVVRAKPQFPGHYQPHLPADIGFYDLRVPEVMVQQAALAREYGIYGFCFYYYWFGGRRVLERPLDTMLALGKPDIPFCICWANENWTRRWDGSEREILLKQEYLEGWDEQLIRDVIPILRAPSYIRVKGAPVFLVYRLPDLPAARKTVERWRQICRSEGIPDIHLCAVHSVFDTSDPRDSGFDAAVEFLPYVDHALVDPAIYSVNPDFVGFIDDYVAVARNQLMSTLPPFTRYRGLMPSWDNTARVNNRAHIVVRSSPADYQTWLTRLVTQSLNRQDVQEPFIFINAWNEWAEAAYLEPDQKYGHAYLEATRQGLVTGIKEYCSAARIPISRGAIESWIGLGSTLSADASPNIIPPSAAPPTNANPRKRSTAKTAEWFTGDQLAAIASLYANFPLQKLSYATVRDYCDSYDHLHPIATANGDLKDCQRPWILKAILSEVPRGGRLLEIGAGEPFIADILQRLGYEVWVVDPYDGSGNGPQDYARFCNECPDVHFVRSTFSEEIGHEVPDRGINCIYSISVLEHIPRDSMIHVFAGLRKFLKPGGTSIHAVDHVHRGNDAAKHLAGLRFMVENFGLGLEELDVTLARMERDTETYYLSAESHNRWRGSVAYDEFPMRVCVSVQIVSGAADILGAARHR